MRAPALLRSTATLVRAALLAQPWRLAVARDGLRFFVLESAALHLRGFVGNSCLSGFFIFAAMQGLFKHAAMEEARES